MLYHKIQLMNYVTFFLKLLYMNFNEVYIFLKLNGIICIRIEVSSYVKECNVL